MAGYSNRTVLHAYLIRYKFEYSNFYVFAFSACWAALSELQINKHLQTNAHTNIHALTQTAANSFELAIELVLIFNLEC